MQRAVLATLTGHEQSTRVVDGLKKAGFTSDDISLLLPDEFGAQELGFEKGNKAAEGTAFGAYIGMILGALYGYIAWSTRLPFFGFNELFIAGPVVASLSVATIGAIIFGLIGGLIGSIIPEYIARKYDRKTRYNSSLLSIHVDNNTELRIIEQVLKTEGAQEIALAAEDSARKKPVQLAS